MPGGRAWLTDLRYPADQLDTVSSLSFVCCNPVARTFDAATHRRVILTG